MKRIANNTSIFLISAMMLFFTGCSADMFHTDIVNTDTSSVSMPEQYSITYEIEDAAGTIHTIKKTVDGEGNTYFQSGVEELLFIKDGEHYMLYEKDANGQFTTQNAEAIYKLTYVDSVTSEFLAYADRSKQHFLPDMEEIGEQEILGRTSLIFGIKHGTENAAFSYFLFVDKETGICLSWDGSKTIAGNEFTADGEIFTCTEFITENIPSLKTLIEE